MVAAAGKKPQRGLADRIKEKLYQILKRKKATEGAAPVAAAPVATEPVAAEPAVKA